MKFVAPAVATAILVLAAGRMPTAAEGVATDNAVTTG